MSFDGPQQKQLNLEELIQKNAPFPPAEPTVG